MATRTTFGGMKVDIKKKVNPWWDPAGTATRTPAPTNDPVVTSPITDPVPTGPTIEKINIPTPPILLPEYQLPTKTPVPTGPTTQDQNAAILAALASLYPVNAVGGGGGFQSNLAPTGTGEVVPTSSSSKTMLIVLILVVAGVGFWLYKRSKGKKSSAPTA